MNATRLPLGKRTPLRYYADVRVKAALYIQDALPATPRTWQWGKGVPLGMFLNDRLPDCTCAAYAHMEEIHSWRNQHPEITLDANVLELYHGTGLDQRLGDQDGRNMELVLRYLRRIGMRQAGGDPNNLPDTFERIIGYAAVNPLNDDEVRTAGYLFGGLYVGAALPLTAADQLDAAKKWSYVRSARNAPGSWGGHAMCMIAINTTGPVFATWGRRQQATWGWWTHYVDEAWAVVTDDWTVGPDAPSPSGFKRAQLVSDLADL